MFGCVGIVPELALNDAGRLLGWWLVAIVAREGRNGPGCAVVDRQTSPEQRISGVVRLCFMPCYKVDYPGC